MGALKKSRSVWSAWSLLPLLMRRRQKSASKLAALSREAGLRAVRLPLRGATIIAFLRLICASEFLPVLPLCDTRAYSRVASLTCRVQTGFIKTSVDLDEELASQVREIASLTREKPATILRTAIRAGLPIVKNRLHDERSKGYFAEAYRHWTDERLKFEARMAKATVQKPQR